MNAEERIRKMLNATDEQLVALDAALMGKATPQTPASLRLLSMGEAAVAMGVSRCTVWRMVRDGALKAVEIRPGSRRIPENELRRFAGL